MFSFQGAKLINIHYICSEIFIIFILKIFKNIAIKNRIQKNLKRRANYLNGNKLQIHKVGCIVDIEEVHKVDFLKNFIKEYGINSENYVILGYEERGIDIQIEGIPLFSWKDINYSGGIRNYHADRLWELEYDLLINCFSTPKLPLLLLSSGVKAKLRIGVSGIDPAFNDVIITAPLADGSTFIQEAEKIIKTLQ